MSVPQSVRVLVWRARRRPRLLWGLVAAVGVALIVQGLVSARPPELVEVSVLRTDVVIGETIEADDVSIEEIESDGAPPGAALGSIVGRVANTAMYRGEIVIEARLGSPWRGPVAGLLDDGHAGLAVGLPAASPPLLVGDRVDLVSTATETAQLVAFGVLVVAVTDDTVTVSVPADAVEDLALDASLGLVLPILAPDR